MIETNTIRHDFQNQLAIVRCLAEVLLAEGGPVDPRRRDLKTIHAATVAAIAMIPALCGDHVAETSA